jgi:hypothetical protein
MLLLIRPKHFGFNTQTAGSNVFQQALADDRTVQEHALREFDALVELLHMHDIPHIVYQDSDLPVKPDAVFPNNWFSTHEDGTLVLYPMMAANRRAERRADIINALHAQGYDEVIDLSAYEQEGKYLEGTGSIVLDRKLRYAYMCLSERSNEQVLDDFCKRLGYEKVVFRASTSLGTQIYHTNVLMSIGRDVCVLAAELIRDEEERKFMMDHLEQYYRLVLLSEAQVMQFAGNMFYVANKHGESYWLMSTTAFNALNAEQRNILQSDGRLLATQIDTIEQCGGGSVRCMLAEVVG